ncbi:MAG: 6,7-dimethyl-8-ribityllumazine synthase [Rickettsiales bacterium]
MPAFRIAIVAASFHARETDAMIAEVRRVCAQNGASEAMCVLTPGAMEMPLALKRALRRSDVDAAVALGIIEKGETLHGAVMGEAVIRAVIGLQLEYMKPIGTGILGPGISADQVQARVVPYARAAAEAAIHMLHHT